jgi:tetratricopeptide repeat protein
VAILRLTAASGHYLQPYARLLLAVAALRDGNRSQARELLAGLVQEFPQNQLYATELARLQ